MAGNGQNAKISTLVVRIRAQKLFFVENEKLSITTYF